MRVKFLNVDSAGNAVTTQKKVQYDGESHSFQVFKTGTANVPEELGQYLIESDNFAVEPYDPDSDN